MTYSRGATLEDGVTSHSQDLGAPGEALTKTTPASMFSIPRREAYFIFIENYL